MLTCLQPTIVPAQSASQLEISRLHCAAISIRINQFDFYLRSATTACKSSTNLQINFDNVWKNELTKCRTFITEGILSYYSLNKYAKIQYQFLDLPVGLAKDGSLKSSDKSKARVLNLPIREDRWSGIAPFSLIFFKLIPFQKCFLEVREDSSFIQFS